MTKSPVSKKEGYAMNEDTVASFRQPGLFSADPLTDVLRSTLVVELVVGKPGSVQTLRDSCFGFAVGQPRHFGAECAAVVFGWPWEKI